MRKSIEYILVSKMISIECLAFYIDIEVAKYWNAIIDANILSIQTYKVNEYYIHLKSLLDNHIHELNRAYVFVFVFFPSFHRFPQINRLFIFMFICFIVLLYQAVRHECTLYSLYINIKNQLEITTKTKNRCTIFERNEPTDEFASTKRQLRC